MRDVRMAPPARMLWRLAETTKLTGKMDVGLMSLLVLTFGMALNAK